MITKQQVWSALYGAAAGDAVGVPYEFRDRDEMIISPATEMTGGGTYGLPAGTWSDDTSMILCTLDNLDASLDWTAVMDAFLQWVQHGAYTPYGVCFDIGNTTAMALSNFKRFRQPLKAGMTSESRNGNGSLMRIIPAALYAAAHDLNENEAIGLSETLSSLTHAHRRSLIGCGIFTLAARALLRNPTKEAVVEGIAAAKAYYDLADSETRLEVRNHYARVLDGTIASLPEEEIHGFGNVVDTLKCALWCLLNTGSYRDCVLKAVNFGNDTDTTACVAGALAGLLYGMEGIPSHWRDALANRQLLDQTAEQFCRRNGVE